MENPWLKDNLTARQTEYVAELASGKSTEDIAETLFVSKHTVRNTITSAKERVGAESTINLVVMALEKGWIRKTDSDEIPLKFQPC